MQSYRPQQHSLLNHTPVYLRPHPPGGVAVHDEAHDGLEVVSVEGHLRLLGHVDTSGVPRPLAVAQSLQPLAGWNSVTPWENLNKTNKQTNKKLVNIRMSTTESDLPRHDVCGDHLQKCRVSSPDLPPGVAETHQALRNTPAYSTHVTNTHGGLHLGRQRGAHFLMTWSLMSLFWKRDLSTPALSRRMECSLENAANRTQRGTWKDKDMHVKACTFSGTLKCVLLYWDSFCPNAILIRR